MPTAMPTLLTRLRPVAALLTWLRSAWTALGLRGRLVAGYTALFAVLLIGIAVGETTVVRQVLIDDRKAALPNATSDLLAALKGPLTLSSKGAVGLSVQQWAGTLHVVSGDSTLVVALFAADGTVVYQQVGAAVGRVDPRQLLDRRAISAATGGDPGTPTTYQRAAGENTYLVQVQSGLALPVLLTQPPGLGGAVTTGPLTPDSGAASTRSSRPPSDLPAAANVTLLVAESLRPVDDTVQTLLIITLAASALGLLVAAAVGLAVARRALRPLDRMTATAQAIAAGGDGALDRRLRLAGQSDEVGRLALTFDHMLDRIQATIAERVRSETRLRHFAADASHELRTPLAAVSGYTEVLLMGGKDDPDTAVHALRQMEGELTRMTRLVEDLLTLARLDAGVSVRTQALPVVPMLEGVAEEARLLAARAGRALVVAVDALPAGAADLTVQADPDRLHQILLNLLHNAVKFTPDGGGITLGATQRAGMVALSVTDTGVGIAADEIPQLFERFYRSDAARARGDEVEAGGAGLGLAIAQGLAQSQSGCIEVASTPGAGSTFSVILPSAPPGVPGIP